MNNAIRVAPSSRTSKGFTLIELLVVVAIIAVLMALLLPSLARARENAKTAACASTMRQIGLVFQNFAAENNDRGPGMAHRTQPSSASVSWVDLLNIYYFNGEKSALDYVQGRGGGAITIHNRGTVVGRKLVCPNYVAWETTGAGTKTNRVWAYNMYAQGYTTGSGSSTVYYTGPAVIPSDNTLAYDTYFLGYTKFANFNSSFQFLLIETGGYSDVFSASYPYNANTPVVSAANPPGTWQFGAYRHSNYTLGNFLFFDAHVETMAPSGRINNDIRIKPQQ